MRIFVTGGAGYIGSHTCLELLNSGHEVFVFDNFSNSNPEAIERVKRIAHSSIELIRGDIQDKFLLTKTLSESRCEVVIHFAGLKSVAESVVNSVAYYENNVCGTLSLISAMKECNVKKLVFSSSATVYGEPLHLPLNETHPLSATNPYGRTKLIIEDILRDLFISDPTWAIGILRYFNPVGSHSSGFIGEDPNGTPNNLMPYVAQVAIGLRAKLKIFGQDYQTPDGTGVRDYIHVVDLAVGHLRALDSLISPQCFSVNLGTGIGYSVLDVVRAFERVSGKVINFEIHPRRQGDVAVCFANPALAETLLNWRAERSLLEMCEDHWRWQSMNPNGYKL